MNALIRTRSISAAFCGLACALLATSCSREARSQRFLRSADAHFTGAQYEAAEIEYKNALMLSPVNAHAIGRLGIIYRAEGRTGPALSFLLKAKELEPDNAEVRLNLGLAYLSAGAASAARAEALFVLERNPNSPEAPLLLAESSATPTDRRSAEQRLLALKAGNRSAVLTGLGQLALRSGQQDRAQELFQQALTADPKYAPAASLLGSVLWARKDVVHANEKFKQAADASPIRSLQRLQYAQFKLQTGDREAGKQLLADLTKQAPDFVPGWLARIEVAAAEKKYADAEAMLREALTRDTSNLDLLLLDGRVQMAEAKFDAAITGLERTVSLYPRSPMAIYLLGSAYMAKGELTKAAESMTRVLKLVPDYEPAAAALGELNVRRGSYGAAVTNLKNVAAKHGDDLRAQLLLAQAYVGTGDLSSALAMYEKLEKRYPQDASLPYLRGQVLRAQGKAQPAREAYSRALALSPTAVPPVQQLCEMDVAEKAFDRARQRIEFALARSPKSVDLFMLLAGVAIAQENWTDAQVALQRAIAQQPNAPGPYIALARLYVTSHEEDKAFAQLREIRAKDPNNVDALTIAGVLHDTVGQAQQAREAYEKVLEQRPDAIVALNNLAYLLAARPEDLGRAYELAQRARNLLPEDPRTADTLGWILCRKGEYGQAIALLRDSAAKLPDTPDAQYHLGVCSYMLGDEPTARAALRRALAADRSFTGMEDAKRKVAVLDIDGGAATAVDRSLLERIASENPPDPVAFCRLAAIHEATGEWGKAHQYADSAVRASPKNSRANAQLARILAAEGDRAHALEYARTAHTLAPDDAEATYVLAQVAYADGQYRWAASLLDECATALPTHADVQFDWAHAALAVGRVTDAQAAARRVIELAPESTKAKEAGEFIALLAIASDPSSSKDTSIVDSALKRDPANPAAMMARATLAERRNGGTNAQIAYEQLLARYADCGPAQKALSTLYAAAPKPPTSSLVVATKARETYPNDPAVARALGIICFKQGEYRRAATLLEESAAANARDGELLFYLGMSQSRLKRSADAKRTLQRALDAGLRNDLESEARRAITGPN